MPLVVGVGNGKTRLSTKNNGENPFYLTPTTRSYDFSGEKVRPDDGEGVLPFTEDVQTRNRDEGLPVNHLHDPALVHT